MGVLERQAALARSRGESIQKLGETPSWWMTSEKLKNRKKDILEYDFIEKVEKSQDIEKNKETIEQVNFVQKMISKILG